MEKFKSKTLKINKLCFITSSLIIFACPFSGCKKISFERENLTPIVIQPIRLNLGDIGEAQSKNGAFTLRNVGNCPIEIKTISASCGCTIASTNAKFIEPSQSAALTVKLIPGGRQGAFESQIAVEWVQRREGGLTGRATATVQGNALFRADLTPNNLDFGEVSDEKDVPSKIIIVTRGTQLPPFIRASIVGISENLIGQIDSISDNQWRISTSLFSKGLPVGHFLGSLKLVFYDAGGKELGSRDIVVRAEKRGLISAIPETLYFGVVAKGGVADLVFTLFQPEGRISSIHAITAAPHGEALDFKILETNKNQTKITVHFDPGILSGNLSGRIFLQFTDPAMGNLVIPYMAYVD